MTEPYDAIEREMGISSYMSTEHSGFAAVLKARYSDFVVHEGMFYNLTGLNDIFAYLTYFFASSESKWRSCPTRIVASR
jgi:hypothetical protein